MSREENLAMARRAIELYNAHAEEDQAADMVHPDFVWIPAMSRLEGSEFHGLEGMRQRREELDAGFRDVRFEIDSLRAFGSDTVVVAGRLHGTGITSGAAVSGARGLVIRFRDGKIAWAASYPSQAEAIRVAEEEAAP